MCQSVFFKDTGKVADSIDELAQFVGGADNIVIRRGYGRRKKVIREGNSCLCPVDIEKTFAPFDYILTRWEDAFDFTVRKPEWLIDREKREHDKRRYDAAMAEMRAA